METKKQVTFAVTPHYRKADSFHYIGNTWSDFLERWNDPNITLPEAKGLIHAVPGHMSMDDNWPERCGEDRRPACIRFILHYAGRTVKFDNDWQIIEKARSVLVNKILDDAYIIRKAPVELVLEVIQHFFKRECFPEREPGKRKLEQFIRDVRRFRKNREVVELLDTLSRKFAP